MNAANLNQSLNRIGTRLKRVSPYFLLELLLPGGSVFALLLWMHRRNQAKAVLKAAVPAAGKHEAEIPACICRA